MNKQIEKLAAQSGWSIDKLSAVNADNQNRKLQEFAELIIQECIKIIEPDAPISAMYVRNQFGVE